MLSTPRIALLTLALSLGAFISGARAGELSIPADCCETLCEDMPSCANMLMCQACSASSAHYTPKRVLDYPHRMSFPHLGDDRPPSGPGSQIWTPPDLRILDDFGMDPLNAVARNDMLEVIESRNGSRATLVTSQLPVNHWHEYLKGGNPTVEDAVSDRLVSGSQRMALTGESMRKQKRKKT